MDSSDEYAEHSDSQPAKTASAAAAPPKLGKGDAYEYWQQRLGGQVGGDDDDDDDSDDDDEIEESKEAGKPNPFADESDHYSDEELDEADDDDFELSQTIKKDLGPVKAEKQASGHSSKEPSPARPLAAHAQREMMTPQKGQPRVQAQLQRVEPGRPQSKPAERIQEQQAISVHGGSEPGEELDGGFIEESLNDRAEQPSGGKDLLASKTNERIEFEHFEQRDPDLDAADEQVREQLNQIEPQFDDTKGTTKQSEPKTETRRARPTTAKARAPSAQPKPAPVKAAEATKKKETKVPTEKDLENQKKAAARVKAAAEAKRAAEQAARDAPKKKYPDPAKVKEKIKQNNQKKNLEVETEMKKLKHFKMPKRTPKLGGTEQDLEQQIHNDILDLEIQLNTDNFGQKAIAAEKERDEKRQSR